MSQTFRAVSAALALFLSSQTMSSEAQISVNTPPKDVRDILALDVTVSASVQPDLAVMTLAVDRQGTDAAAMTAEVNQVLARAVAEAKTVAGVQVATGAYNTQARYDNKGQRNGWMVRAEIILKGRDFGVLSKLSGKLAKDLQIASNGFEISPELRAKEDAALVERAITAWRAKAQAATRAFGNTSFAVREVSVGQIGGGVAPQPKMMMRAAMAAAESDASVPMEAGAQNLSLTVTGSVQMLK